MLFSLSTVFKLESTKKEALSQHALQKYKKNLFEYIVDVRYSSAIHKGNRGVVYSWKKSKVIMDCGEIVPVSPQKTK